jgi:hypothetical protein
VNLININGFNKKMYFSTNISPFFQYTFEGVAIEDIGSTGYLFPRYAFCDPLTQGLRCYEDTIIGLDQFWIPGSSCDTIIYYLGEEELKNNDELLISSNPTTDFITIHYNSTFLNEIMVSVFNIYGQPLPPALIPQSGRWNGNSREIKIDMRNFQAGIYFVKVRDGKREIVRRVVKY